MNVGRHPDTRLLGPARQEFSPRDERSEVSSHSSGSGTGSALSLAQRVRARPDWAMRFRALLPPITCAVGERVNEYTHLAWNLWHAIGVGGWDQGHRYQNSFSTNVSQRRGQQAKATLRTRGLRPRVQNRISGSSLDHLRRSQHPHLMVRQTAFPAVLSGPATLSCSMISIGENGLGKRSPQRRRRRQLLHTRLRCPRGRIGATTSLRNEMAISV